MSALVHRSAWGGEGFRQVWERSSTDGTKFPVLPSCPLRAGHSYAHLAVGAPDFKNPPPFKWGRKGK